MSKVNDLLIDAQRELNRAGAYGLGNEVVALRMRVVKELGLGRVGGGAVIDLLARGGSENETLEEAIHYPRCWDVAAYPTAIAAVKEVFTCSECAGEK